jgi:hypothetical protein
VDKPVGGAYRFAGEPRQLGVSRGLLTTWAKLRKSFFLNQKETVDEKTQ